MVVPGNMEEVARDLVIAIDEAKQGTFQPQRENDELTRALKNPEHPGEPAASAWSHGKLFGSEIAHIRLIEGARLNRTKNPCYTRRDE